MTDTAYEGTPTPEAPAEPTIVGDGGRLGPALKTPLEGLSAQQGGHVERILGLRSQLLAAFDNYETTRKKLDAEHHWTMSFDFGGPINAALETWRDEQGKS